MEAIYRDDAIVGYIRTAEYAFALDTVIASGYISNPSGGKVNKDYIMSGMKILRGYSSGITIL